MPIGLLLTYIAACFIVAVVPGPVVSLVVANSLTKGVRAGLLNVAGTQIGLALMLFVLLLGLEAVVAFLGEWFTWIKLLGAVYLVWAGWKLISGTGTVAPEEGPDAGRGYVWQGFVVNLSNPKVLLFTGAFIPQFMTGGNDHVVEAILLMLIFMAVTAACDSAYAVTAGAMRTTLSGRGRWWLAKGSGVILIAGGVWLAALRR
jgi:threonine/homoserine/homoserine lactone efflux protein